MLPQFPGWDGICACVFQFIKGDEVLITCMALRDDGTLSYRRMSIELCFYLTQFNAKAANFDLGINPAEVLNAAIVQPARQVSRLIHASAGLKWVGNEFLARQFGTIQISSGQSIAGNMQLAWYPDRLKIPISIKNINLRVRNGGAYGNKIILLQETVSNLYSSAYDRCFCWAIGVLKIDCRTVTDECTRSQIGQFFATND